jgi:hypothetical protein
MKERGRYQHIYGSPTNQFLRGKIPSVFSWLDGQPGIIRHKKCVSDLKLLSNEDLKFNQGESTLFLINIREIKFKNSSKNW